MASSAVLASESRCPAGGRRFDALQAALTSAHAPWCVRLQLARDEPTMWVAPTYPARSGSWSLAGVRSHAPGLGDSFEGPPCRGQRIHQPWMLHRQWACGDRERRPYRTLCRACERRSPGGKSLPKSRGPRRATDRHRRRDVDRCTRNGPRRGHDRAWMHRRCRCSRHQRSRCSRSLRRCSRYPQA